MKNKIINSFILFTFVFSYILSFLSYFEVEAMSVSEIKSRDVCNGLSYELAYAEKGGAITNISCHQTYNEAKKILNESTDEKSDNLIILERLNGITQIIDAKYALIDYDQVYGKTTNLYDTVTSKNAFTYITGGSSDDAALIDFDYSTRRIKIKVSGYIGWMDKYDSNGRNQYDIIPLSWISSCAYYQITSTDIRHYIPSNVFGTGTLTYVTFGPKPTQLEVGNYYSYDGKYFYKDLKTMLIDYKNGNYENSVNKNNPYYNYYLYLSHRTKSNYTAEDINNYVTKVLGYTKKATAYKPKSSESMLYDEGASFTSAENLYGTNALLMFGVARNESGNGRSRISIEKNNLFGHNAVDSDPYAQGSSYINVGYGIYAHSYKWLSYGYLKPGDYRFMGGNVGTKAQGIDVKYASDPYWGEKAAANYYQFDKYYGLQDYNTYALAVKTSSTTVYPTKSPKTGDYVNKTYYKLKLMDTPIVIVGETTGESVNGNNKWYKIMSDPTLDSNLNYIGAATSNPRIEYNWNTNYVYVPATYFTRINDVEYKNPALINKTGNIIEPEKPDEEQKPNIDKPEQNQPAESPKPSENLPSVDNSASNLQYREGYLYHFESFNYNKNTKLIDLSGFLGITGMDNKLTDNISHRLIFKKEDSDIEYVYNLERWKENVPFEMVNSDEKIKYDYSGGWFKSSLDISNLPQGDYKVFIEVSNGNYKTRTYFNNLLNKPMISKITMENGKGFNFQMNYYEKTVPLEVSVRNNGLITTSLPPTNDQMYNSFTKLALNGNILSIRGTSHNVGVDYSEGVNVERTIFLENVSTFERYKYNVGSITNGDYQVTLKVSDNKDKTRSWFDANIDISKLPKGIYAIYIKTKGDGGEDYGELNDLLYTQINQSTTINGNKVSLRRVDQKRFRIELVIE